jgi:hypothetical protein
MGEVKSLLSVFPYNGFFPEIGFQFRYRFSVTPLPPTPLTWMLTTGVPSSSEECEMVNLGLAREMPLRSSQGTPCFEDVSSVG